MEDFIEITVGGVTIFGSRGRDYIEIGHNSFETREVPLSEVPFLLEAIQQVAGFVGG